MAFASLDDNAQTVGLALSGNRKTVHALIIGAAEVLSIQYIDPLLSDVVPFLVLLVMLVLRPWGLFGKPEALVLPGN